jgi:hypothetical protein
MLQRYFKRYNYLSALNNELEKYYCLCTVYIGVWPLNSCNLNPLFFPASSRFKSVLKKSVALSMEVKYAGLNSSLLSSGYAAVVA